MDIGTRIGGTGNAGANGITDTVNEGSAFLGQLDGSKGIGRFTTLGNGNDHVVLRNDRIAIAELGGIFYFNGNATERLDELLAYQTSVPRRTTSHDDHALGAEQLATIVDKSRQRDMIALDIDSTTHTVSQAVGLFKDFL